MGMNERAAAGRSTERKGGPAAATRDRERPMRVYVSDAERAEIEQRAKAANRTTSDFLRSAALEAETRSRADAAAVLALCGANAELERLCALLGRLRPEAAGEAADQATLRELLARLPEARRRLAAAADALA